MNSPVNVSLKPAQVSVVTVLQTVPNDSNIVYPGNREEIWDSSVSCTVTETSSTTKISNSTHDSLTITDISDQDYEN